MNTIKVIAAILVFGMAGCTSLPPACDRDTTPEELDSGFCTTVIYSTTVPPTYHDNGVSIFSSTGT